MAARGFAYHACETADSDKFCCCPWHCSFMLTPTMINHLTSIIVIALPGVWSCTFLVSGYTQHQCVGVAYILIYPSLPTVQFVETSGNKTRVTVESCSKHQQHLQNINKERVVNFIFPCFLINEIKECFRFPSFNIHVPVTHTISLWLHLNHPLTKHCSMELWVFFATHKVNIS